MKVRLIISSVVAAMLVVGCGSSDTKANDEVSSQPTSARFSTMVMMNDTVEQDNTTKLEWVGSAGTNACQPNASAGAEDGAIAMAKDHCDALVFAGHDDWRMATAAENEVYIKGMKEAEKTPFYGNPGCPRLIGSDGTTAMAVNTHNSDPIGKMALWSEFLMSSGGKNYGVKCVREQ